MEDVSTQIDGTKRQITPSEKRGYIPWQTKSARSGRQAYKVITSLNPPTTQQTSSILFNDYTNALHIIQPLQKAPHLYRGHEA